MGKNHQCKSYSDLSILQSSSSSYDERQFRIIINVSFGGDKMGFLKLSAYYASKFGIIGITESVAAEINGNDIRIML